MHLETSSVHNQAIDIESIIQAAVSVLRSIGAANSSVGV